MAKADRLARLDVHRAELEAEYRDALVKALRDTAAGRWGLFGHTDDRGSKAAAAPVLAKLGEMSAVIDDMRDRLAMPSFELHREFLASRGRPKSDAVGEPKQAKAWLVRLDPPASSNGN